MNAPRRPAPPEELIQAYLDGEIAHEEAQQLRDWLGASPANVEEFVRQIEIHAALWERSVALAEIQRDSQPQARPSGRFNSRRVSARTMSRRSGRRTGAAASAWRVAVAVATAAAAILIAVWAGHPGKAAGTWTAQVAGVSGPVEVRRAGAALVPASGFLLQPADELRTAGGARAEVRLADGTSIDLNERTTLALAGPGARVSGLDLATGEIYIEAAKQEPGRPLVFNPGRHDEAVVAGTTFELARAEHETVLRVAEGRVRFGPAASAVSVEPLQASRVAPGGSPSAPEPVTLAMIAPWRNEPDRGLVGCWKFDEGQGSVARDSSGLGHHGKIVGAAWVAGKSGGALRFDGDRQFVDVGHGPALSCPRQVTVAAWVEIFSGPAKDAWQCLIGQLQPSRNYNLYVRNASPGQVLPQEQMQVFFSHQWDKPGWCGSETDFLLQPGVWHHVAATATTEDDGTHRYYIDGKLVKESRNVGFARLVTSGTDFRLGWGSQSFSGCLDEVRVYNRALSGEEIARLAAGTEKQ